jgi:hypothetical protein
VTDKANGVTYSACAALEDVGDVGDEYNYCRRRRIAASATPTRAYAA